MMFLYDKTIVQSEPVVAVKRPALLALGILLGILIIQGAETAGAVQLCSKEDRVTMPCQ